MKFKKNTKTTFFNNKIPVHHLRATRRKTRRTNFIFKKQTQWKLATKSIKVFIELGSRKIHSIVHLS